VGSGRVGTAERALLQSLHASAAFAHPTNYELSERHRNSV
jgi:hypothetical protein